MSFNYKKLFEVHFEHQFFTDLRFTGLKVFPAADTQAAFLKYGLLIKEQAEGFTIFFADQFGGTSRERTDVLLQKVNLQFIFKITDPSFYTYTGNIPDDTVHKIFRFSNFDEKRQVVKKSPLLHVADFAGEPEIQQPRSNFNANGDIDIYLHDQLEEDLFIRFLNRSMHWRYIIVGEHLQQSGNLAIVDKDNKKIFSGPVIAALPDGSKGIAFTSDQPIAVTQKANPHFQLVVDYDDTTNHFERVLISHLPAPSLSSGPKNNEIIIYL